MEALDAMNNIAIPDSLIPVTVPKKRGRPSKPNKIVKLPSGRGRGRPSKNTATSVITIIQKGNNIERLDAENNYKCNPAPEEYASTRGRPPKSGKGKLTHSIVATGKGRGRPKKSSKEDDIDRKHQKVSQAISVRTSGKHLGQPRKRNSDDESSEEKNSYEEERHPVGRPRTGGMHLNIEKTERGQGRPKKRLAAKRSATSIGQEVVTLPKKRGRPCGVGRNKSPQFHISNIEEIDHSEPAMSNNASRSDDNENSPSSSDEKNIED